MTNEEVEAEIKIEAERIATLDTTIKKIEHYLALINESEEGEEVYKEAIFEDFPWVEQKII